MSSSLSWLKKQAKKYDKLSELEKTYFIEEAYHTQKMGWPEIAEMVGTYPNKISRDATALGIKKRTRAEAQALSLERGRREHPTKGKKHSAETKAKIGDKQAEVWQNLSEEEREHRSQIGKDHWDSLTPEEKEYLVSTGGDAIRKAAKEGSKLEKFLFTALTKAGYSVEFHRERVIANENLQLDLFIPKLKTAIEVDGPSHFEPVWGKEVLERNKRADAQKNGLILAQGWCMVRIRQTSRISDKFTRDILAKLLKVLENIKTSYPERKDRLIIVGGTDE